VLSKGEEVSHRVDFGDRMPRQNRRDRGPGPENEGADHASEDGGEHQGVCDAQSAWASGGGRHVSSSREAGTSGEPQVTRRSTTRLTRRPSMSRRPYLRLICS